MSVVIMGFGFRFMSVMYPAMPSTRLLRLVTALFTALTLVACGGGGGSSGGAATTGQPNQATNRAPTLTGQPQTSVSVGTPYTFQPVATDPDGDPLTFSIQNKPTWASFSTTNGALTGTPAAGHAGTYAAIVVTVGDGKTTTSLPAFTINVTAQPSGGNRPPVISGTPPTSITVGVSYSFQPTASDPDGNSLTFNVQNPPAWATFNQTNGRLSGTPSAGNVGTFANVVISVSDGNLSAALAPFSITVNQIATGAATIIWTPPTTNTDGTALTNLAGFRIQYGTNANALNQTIQIANPGLTTYVVQNLSPATWYFTMTAYTTAGTESSRTNPASTVIQ